MEKPELCLIQVSSDLAARMLKEENSPVDTIDRYAGVGAKQHLSRHTVVLQRQ